MVDKDFYKVDVLRPNGVVYETHKLRSGVAQYIQMTRKKIRDERGWTPDFRVYNEFGKDVSASFRG